MSEKKRTVIIGIDGVPFSQIKALADKEVMPNMKDLIREGHFSSMRSSIPDVSSVSWSTIITGQGPGVHGIYGFTHIIPGTYTLSFPNFQALKAPPFWKRGDDRRYVIINVPFTYPASELNGFLVAGFVALDMKRAVFPSTYLPTLQEMGYEIDVDANKWHKSKDLFMRELFRTLETRVELGEHLWNESKWDTYMFVFTGSDRIGHLLWYAYEDPNSDLHEEFLRYYSEVDKAIGDIIGRMGEDDALMMLSDHGMEGINARVNLNTVLMEEGFLRFGDEPKKNYNNLKSGTLAFSMDPGRVHLNIKGKFPKGEVPTTKVEDELARLEDVFGALRHKGENVVKRMFRGKDIYQGPNTVNAPDLVLEPNKGFSLRSNLEPKPLFEEDRFEGKHTPEAFLYVRGDVKDIVSQDPGVEDVVTIMDSLQEK